MHPIERAERLWVLRVLKPVIVTDMISKCVFLWGLNSFLFILPVVAQDVAANESSFVSSQISATHPTGSSVVPPHFSSWVDRTHTVQHAHPVEFKGTSQIFTDGMESTAEYGSISMPQVNLSVNKTSVEEGESVMVTVSLSESVQGRVEVLLEVIAVTAPLYDFDRTPFILAEFASGETQFQHEIETYEDPEDAIDETFTVGIKEVSADDPFVVTIGSSRLVEITILDTAPHVSLSADQNSVEEGEIVTLTVSLSKALDAGLRIPLKLTAGTAESDDYDSISPVNVDITSGQTKKQHGILTYVDTDAANETFTVEIDADKLPSQVRAGSPLSTVVTITDTSLPTVRLSVGQNSVEEGKSVTVTVGLSESLTTDVTIPLTLTAGTAESGDYDSTSPINVTVPGGQTQVQKVINTYKDSDTEDETFTISIDATDLPNTVKAGSSLSEVITITDIALPTVSLSVGQNSVEEGESVTVTVGLSESLTTDVTIPLTLTAGTAESSDYDSTSPINVTVPGGQTQVQKVINTYKDSDTEDETFTISIDATDLPNTVKAGSSLSEVITITDIALPTVSLSVGQNSVEEGESVTVTVGLSESLTTDVTIPLTLTAGTAESGDYDSASPINVTIASGQTQVQKVINTNTDTDTDDETFTVAIDAASLPNTVKTGSSLSAVITITDTSLPTVSLSVDQNSVEEGESVTVTVGLSESLTANITIPLTLTAGTAESGDYDSASPINVTIASGQTQVQKVINTNTDTDTDDETFTVAIDAASLPNTVKTGSSLSAVITITDTSLPTVSLSVDQNSVEEGESVTVTVGLSESLTANITIPLTLTAGTAESGDYDSVSPINVTVPGGQTQVQKVINTYKDSDTEDETFTIAIDAVSLPNTVVAGSSLSEEITIEDTNSPRVNLSVDKNSVEEGQPVTVDIELSSDLDADIMIPVKLTAGTAESSDYESTSPINIKITSGETEFQHIIETYEDDDTEEETFTVAIDADNLPVAVRAGRQLSEEITIVDITVPTVRLSVDPDSVQEGESVTVTVGLSAGLDIDVTIPVKLTKWTAESDDYDSTSPVNLNIISGKTEVQHVIETYADTDTEDESFIVSIDKDNLPSGVGLGSSTSAQVEIIDNTKSGLTAPASVEIEEGGSEEVGLELMTQPSSNVTVTIAGHENSDLELDKTTLIFTRDTYNTPQIVTLITREDSDLLDDEVTLTLTATGGGYSMVSHTITVTIQDNMGVSIEDEDTDISITLWGNYPNPVSDFTEIEFDLPESAQISVRVTDLLGRIVQMMPYGWFEAGKGHTAKVGTENLTTGIYYYTLMVDTGDQVIQRSQAMSVVR